MLPRGLLDPLRDQDCLLNLGKPSPTPFNTARNVYRSHISSAKDASPNCFLSLTWGHDPDTRSAMADTAATAPTRAVETREPLRVLVCSKTTAYRHASIPAGISALNRLSAASLAPDPTATAAVPSPSDNGVPVSPVPLVIVATEATESVFTPAALSSFTVVVLLQNSGAFLSTPELSALREFVRRGGGVVGVHCASTGMPRPAAPSDPDPDSDRWYSKLVGAEFDQHPEPQQAVVEIVDPRHPIIGGTVGKGRGKWSVRGEDKGNEKTQGEEGVNGQRWKWDLFDEWYNFKEHPRATGNLHVLLAVDESSYKGGKHGDDHPIAWCQEIEGGRSFYTALGHFDEAYEDEAFLGQLLNGILWAARIII